MTETPQLLRALTDEHAIVRLLHDYGSHIDYGRKDAWLGLFAPGGRYELHYRDGLTPRALGRPRAEGNARIYDGIDSLRSFILDHSHAPDRWHKHFVAGWRITLNGDSADCQSIFQRIDQTEGGARIVAAGRYLDQLVRDTDGTWRFAVRIAEIEIQ